MKILKGSVWSKKSFPFLAENMTIRSILNLWWHSEILKLILGVVRGMFTKRLKGTRRLLYTGKSEFLTDICSPVLIQLGQTKAVGLPAGKPKFFYLGYPRTGIQ